MAERSTKENREWSGKPRGKCLLLEVSSDWIKLIETTGGRGGVVLTRLHLEAADREMDVADCLRRALSVQKFTRMPLIVSVPRQLVNVRLLELPSTEASEIGDMVDLQVGRQTPYSLNEILSGYKVLGSTRQGTYTRVMLAIVQRSIVRERYYDIEAAGLSVDRMTISCEGVLNWFLYHTRREDPERVLALLDVDSFFTHMVVVQHRRVVFTKSILWGANQAGEGLEAFCQRAQEAFQSCNDALRGGSAIEEVRISGAGVRIAGIAEALAPALSIPCRTADSLEDVKVEKGCQARLHDERHATASLTALVGMAMGPNLLSYHFVPDVVRLRDLIRKRAGLWAALASLLLSASVAASLYGMLAAGYRMDRVNTLKAQADAIQPRVVRVERMMEVVRAVRRRQVSRFLPENLLPVIHASVPDGVYVESLEINVEHRRLALAGTAPARKDIRDLIRMLEESPFFEGVEEGGRTAMDRNERFVFQVVGRFKEGGRQ